MNKSSITILTEPLPSSLIGLYGFGRQVSGNILRYIKSQNSYQKGLPRFGGHPAVTRSLISGLTQLGLDFTYNPKSVTSLSKNIAVLSNTIALRQAITWKRAGTIDRLIAGPNLFEDPRRHRSQIEAPEIDVYLVNSHWTHDLYLTDCPGLNKRCKIWPAGIDSEFWSPLDKKKGKRCLLYVKNVAESMWKNYLKLLEDIDYQVEVLHYGTYNSDQYLDLLRRVEFSLVLSPSESQGLALLEAWSVDVPTIVWNPGSLLFHGRVISVSSAPYLTCETGIAFSSYENFAEALDSIVLNKHKFQPRQWVLKNMTDIESAKLFLSLTIPNQYNLNSLDLTSTGTQFEKP